MYWQKNVFVYNRYSKHKFAMEVNMITSLHIKNIGIIDEININLNEGFNVLTGETGAGKTLIIDSLQIIAGGRFSKEIILCRNELVFTK